MPQRHRYSGESALNITRERTIFTINALKKIGFPHTGE
jgi:hypothetical protein